MPRELAGIASSRLFWGNRQDHEYFNNHRRGNFWSNLLAKDGVTYKYDAANRLTAVLSATLVATFEYNPDGLRTAMAVNGVRTSYLWDVAASMPVILTDTTSIYVYGLNLIARQTGSEVEYYHTDALGSVRNLTNGSGQNTGAYTYGPFGESLFTSAASANRFQYTGQMSDAQDGLYFLRARYYEPGTGRFLSRDPFRGFVSLPQSLNPYAYVVNNPLRYEDPSGLQPFWPPIPYPPPPWVVGTAGAGGTVLVYRVPR